MTQPNEFYHYTTKDGAAKIRSSGKILASRLGNAQIDAVYGEGVYLTKLGPDNSKETIARNNWANGWEKAIKDGKVDYVIKLIFPKDIQPQKTGGGRDIYLINEDVILQNCSFDVIEVATFQAQQGGGYSNAAIGVGGAVDLAAIIGAFVKGVQKHQENMR